MGGHIALPHVSIGWCKPAFWVTGSIQSSTSSLRAKPPTSSSRLRPDRADLGLEAKDEDDLNMSSGVSNVTQHWQIHDKDKSFNMQFKAKFYSNLFNKMSEESTGC